MIKLSLGSRIIRWIQSLLEGLISGAEGVISPEARLKTSIAAMEEALESRADSAAFAMATAQETREQLEKKLKECEKYRALARQYANINDDEKGKQSLLLANQAEADVVRLTGLLSQQQADADRYANDYAKQAQLVDERVAQIPELTASARLSAARKQFKSAEAQYNLEGDMASFDEIAGGVHRDRLQASARETLNRNPQEEIRSEIDQDAARRALDEEYASLKAAAGSQTSVSESSDQLLIEHDPIHAAHALLTRPRFEAFTKTRLLK